jgi:phenylalanyl-tRNA synthetase alpha subunit
MVELDEITIELLRKLPPKERILKLKEIQEEKIRELKETEMLIEEIEAEDDKKKKDKGKSEEDLEQITEETSDELSEVLQAEVQRWNHHIQTEAERFSKQPGDYQHFSDFQKQYVAELATHPFDEIYNRIRQVNNQFNQGEISYDNIQTIETLQLALYKKEKDIDSGEYQTSEQIRKQIDSTKQILDQLLTNYRRTE